ncbi:MAG: transferrin-binding protein-like solute binding protein, partial [Neisseriaceae bacterium]|nr:transferrin-binding protein-like solute binding protein [Neisseriaceae bacterium]
CGGGDDDGTNQPVDPVGPTDPTDPIVDPGIDVSDEELQPENDVVDYAVKFDAEKETSITSYVKVRNQASKFDVAQGETSGLRQYSNRMGSLSIGNNDDGSSVLDNAILAQLERQSTGQKVIQLVGIDPFGDAGELHSVGMLNGAHEHLATTGYYPAGYTAGTGNPEIQWLNAPNSVVMSVQGNADPKMDDPNATPLILSGGIPEIADYLSAGSKPEKTTVKTWDGTTIDATTKKPVLVDVTDQALDQVETLLTTYTSNMRAAATLVDQQNWASVVSELTKTRDQLVTKIGNQVKGVMAAYAGVNVSEAYRTGKMRFDDPGNVAIPTAANPQEYGIVAMNMFDGVKQSGITEGNDDKYITTTRIFGHYYLDPGAGGTAPNAFAKPENFNSYLRPEVAASTLGATAGDLVVIPTTLDHVQYGRISANLDPDKIKLLGEYEGTQYYVSPLAEHDPLHANEAVDSYFYRGTGETTVAQMNALPSNAQIDYQGHAIMFGLDNNFHGNKVSGRVDPNALKIAKNDREGIGNFVQAKFDVGAKTITGDVYNLWHFTKDVPGKGSRNESLLDSLVEFKALVKGNTIIGDANLTYDKESKGQIRGSFFGPNANEIGGAFSAVTTSENKVDGEVRWGGAFGAKKVTKEEVIEFTNTDLIESN